MKRMIRYIREHLSLRLGLLIVVIVTVVFTLLFSFLQNRCKHFIQRAAIDRAVQLLDNTAENINGIMKETELVTNYMASTVPHHLHPDSLLVYSRRAIEENPFLTGMAISMEPNYFPEKGRYYSAYSLRDMTPGSDSITTVREEPFEYFDAIWYRTPRLLGSACWVEAFDDFNEGTLSSPDYMTSFCSPMRDDDGHYIGSITASLTLKWLSEAVSSLKPYANSSAIMIGRDGTYLVHPDTAKLFHATIFSDADKRAESSIYAMGRDMIAGHSGMTETIVDGRPAFIFYRPVQRTGWSIAIVCPRSDVFARYDRLITVIWTILCLGILLLMLFCYQTVRHATQPLRLLDEQVRHIAEGHFDTELPESPRHDSIGRLTNSFISMQKKLSWMVNDTRQVNNQLAEHNDQLTHAYQLKMQTNRRRTAFIQNMYHEIRTPLNIISGFSQVLTISLHSLPAEEVSDITSRMKKSADDISHLAQKLEEVITDTSEPVIS